MDEVPLPDYPASADSHDRVSGLVGAITNWFESDALRALVEASNDMPPGRSLSPADLARWYEHYSYLHWDFRRGAERNMVTRPVLAARLADQTLEAARALGLLGHRAPKKRHYQHVIILGGLIRACIVRPRYAAMLVDRNWTFDTITALGAYRALGGDELTLAAALGLNAANEFDAMVAGMSTAFGADVPALYKNPTSTQNNTDWQIADLSGRQPSSVLVAPSKDPGRRANTADTLVWWKKRLGNIENQDILVVTSQIYVPYQGANVLEILGLKHGGIVETVGVPAAINDLGEFTQNFEPHHYLQEIRSAIRGYESLLASCSRILDD